MDCFSIQNQLTQKAKYSFEQPRALIGTVAGAATFESITILPNYYSLARTINQEKTQGLVNPQTVGDIAIPIQLQNTQRGEHFLAFDSCPSDPHRFLMFTTEENLDLEVNSFWLAEGIFKCCPSLFYQ